MKYFTLSFILFTSFLSAQDFESFDLPIDTFLNGSDQSGEFIQSEVSFPNDYNPMWDSWTGWSISTMTDTVTRGFTNQYASISGGGAEGTTHYATAFVVGETFIDASGDDVIITGFYINNSTYAYYSMLEGDSFAKKFGGVDGTDPDYLYVSIKSEDTPNDSLIIYLADFRSDDPAEDYILNEWTWVDSFLTGKISLTMYSSDVGAFGINTPTYFCMDQMEFSPFLSSDDQEDINISVFPNPSTDRISVDSDETISGYSIYDMNGNQLVSEILQKDIDISFLPSSVYILELRKNDGTKKTTKISKI